MKRTCIVLLMMGVVFGMALPAKATVESKYILIISDANPPDVGGGDHEDDALIPYLEGLGHLVNTAGMGGAFQEGQDPFNDPCKVALMNSVGLILVSRRTGSGSYDDDRQNWNQLTTPVFLMSGYLTRDDSSNRWGWTTGNSGDAGNTVTDGIVVAGQESHPFLNGVTLGGSNNVAFFDWSGAPTAGEAPKGVFLPNNISEINSATTLIASFDSRPILFDLPAGTDLDAANGTTNNYGVTGGRRAFFGHWGYDVDIFGREAQFTDFITADFTTVVNNIIKGIAVAANGPPRIDAGNFQNLSLPQNWAKLDGFIFDDDPTGATERPFTDYGTIVWSKVSGPGMVTFQPSAGVEDPCAVFSAPGLYDLQMQVTDDGGNVSTDTVRIRLKNPTTDDKQVARWAMDEGAGTTAADSAGTNDPGTLASVDGTSDPNWTAGWVGTGALEFYSDSYVEIENQTTTDPNLYGLQYEMTAAAWVQSDGLSDQFATIISRHMGYGSGFRFQRNSNGDSVTLHLSGVTNGTPGLAGKSVNDGYWHHVAGTYDGYTITLYVDGEESWTQEASGLITTDPCEGTPYAIGTRLDNAANRGWNGLLDDVRVFSYALSEAEVQALAKLGQNVVPNVSIAQPEDIDSLVVKNFVKIEATTFDLNGDTLSLKWTDTGATGNVSFTPSDGVEDPCVVFSATGMYTLKLTVDDGTVGYLHPAAGPEFSAEVTIQVSNPSCAEILAQGIKLETDLSGPGGVPDCSVDLYDFAAVAVDFLRCYDLQEINCTNPENPFAWPQ